MYLCIVCYQKKIIPSLLSCLDTGKKSTPIPAGIPVLEGFGICSATQKQHMQYQESSPDNMQHFSVGQNTLAYLSMTLSDEEKCIKIEETFQVAHLWLQHLPRDPGLA